MKVFQSNKESLAAVLLLLFASAILAGCSSTDSATQEDCQGTPDEVEACLQDLPI